MRSSGKVECGLHGPQDATFVCQHIVQGLRESVAYGFWCAQEPHNPRPDAWCTACEKKVTESGGEWDDESEAFAGVTLLCAACYDRAREMNAR